MGRHHFAPTDESVAKIFFVKHRPEVFALIKQQLSRGMEDFYTECFTLQILLVAPSQNVQVGQSIKFLIDLFNNFADLIKNVSSTPLIDAFARCSPPL